MGSIYIVVNDLSDITEASLSVYYYIDFLLRRFSYQLQSQGMCMLILSGR